MKGDFDQCGYENLQAKSRRKKDLALIAMKAYSNGLFFIPPMSIRILLSEQIVCCTSRINATYKLDIYVLHIYVLHMLKNHFKVIRRELTS